MLIDYL
jgi:hypothetical protein